MSSMTPGEALLAAYPGRFTRAEAEQWVAHRRAVLVQRLGPPGGTVATASSSCAASGAQAHAQELASAAAQALVRLEAGQGTACERCSRTLPFDRLESAPAAIRCTGCAVA